MYEALQRSWQQTFRSTVIRIMRSILEGPGLSGLFFGMGALCFGVGMILMANAIEPTALGLVALFLALVKIGLSLGPMGLDILLIRTRPKEDLMPYAATVRSALISALIAIVAASAVYELDFKIIFVLSFGLVSATFWRMFLILDQARDRKILALTSSQVPNASVLLMGLLAWGFDVDCVWLLCLIASTGYAAPAMSSWLLSRARPLDKQTSDRMERRISDRLGLAGIAVVAMLMSQLERFLIPEFLTLSDLAIYAAVASVAVAPVKLLTAAAGFYLLPLLISARTPRELKRVVLRQSAVLLIAAVGACLLVLAVSPWVWPAVLPEQFEVNTSLVMAVLYIAFVRLWQGVATTVIRSCGQPKLIQMTNIFAAISMVVSALVAGALSDGELQNFVFYVGVGMNIYAVAATLVASETIRHWNIEEHN